MIIATCCTAFAASSARADDFLSGAGTISCGIYLDARGSPEKNTATANLFSSWAQGYLSAKNIAGLERNPRVAKALPDSPTILVYLDKYCRDNPLSALVYGVGALYNDLPSYK